MDVEIKIKLNSENINNEQLNIFLSIVALGLKNLNLEYLEFQ